MLTFRQRIMLVSLAMLSVFLALPGFAAATAEPVAPIVTEAAHVLVLTPVVVTIITGIALPILIAVIYRIANLTNDTGRAIGGLIAAALAATVERATLVDGSAVFDRSLLLDVGLVYVPQLAALLGFWKPTGVTNRIETRRP